MPVILPRFDFRADFGLASDIGRSRDTNEDASLAAPELALFAIADGMGGHQAGEVAAALALAEIQRVLAGRQAQRVIDAYVARGDLAARRDVFGELRRAVECANVKIRSQASETPSQQGMGTTVDVVWLARDHAFIGHAGDGRVYLARPRAALQLTQDHTAPVSMRSDALGRVTGNQTSRTGITNALGISDVVTVDTLFVDVSRGDRLLLCSDGVHGQIANETELTELLRTGSATRAARALVEHAAISGRDNATALVIDIADRFVKRSERDRGVRAADLERARQSPLLLELPMPFVLSALSAAVEIEVAEGDVIPRVVASDIVSYIVLDGVIKYPDERRVGAGALLFPESLIGVISQGELPIVEQTARLLRMRADDFAEICSDPRLASELYRRLAVHLARMGARGAALSASLGSGKA